MSIACGGNHCLCLSNTGSIYSWGQGVYGQLGQGLDIDKSMEPLLLNKLRGKEITAVFSPVFISYVDCMWSASFTLSFFKWFCVCLW